jgi:glycosyltransferase involved in cell wall biosynthesis
VKIAYLVNSYPLPSQTFIRREILALERRGIEVLRLAMRGDLGALVDPGDIAEHARTEHVLAMGPVRLAARAGGQVGRAPGAALAALRLALTAGAAGAGRGVPGTGGRLRHLIYLAEAAHVARRCREAGASHLHAHFGTNSATVAMLARAMGGPPYSFTVHGPEEFDAPRALMLGEKLRRAAFAVAISSYGRAQLCRWADPAEWERIEVIPCGIEPARFPAPAPLPAGGPHLVAIGRLAEQKGLPVLVEAVARAAPALPGLRLTLVGDGPLRASLAGQIARAGLGERVRLAGWLDEAGVRAELAAATALALPSFAEGLPMVLMEAFAAGRPALATAIAGHPELVDAETGWLVPAGDAGALAQAIAALAATPPERLAAMGAAARARVLARHDIDRSAERLAALFARSLAAGVPA